MTWIKGLGVVLVLVFAYGLGQENARTAAKLRAAETRIEALTASNAQLADSLQRGTAELEKQAAALGAYSQSVAVAAEQLTKQQGELRHALNDNQNWARTRVPDGVANSLRSATSSVPASTAAAPAGARRASP